MKETRSRNGIILRFPFTQKNKKSLSFKVNFFDFFSQKLKEGFSLGYTCFIFELADEDFHVLDFSLPTDRDLTKWFLDTKSIRFSFYIKSKKYLTSELHSDVEESINEIKDCLSFVRGLTKSPQESPIILHIGGARGDRRSTMERFCSVIESNFLPEEISRLAVINDDKPSLFSVKDLLPGVFYRLRIPIIFRSTSYPTNQGNLTLNESLFLAGSTWDRKINPIFIYLPGGESPDISGESSPFGLQLDVVFDNKLPEPSN